MSDEPNTAIERLFGELVELDGEARAARLDELALDAVVAREVESLLAADARAGDFLGVRVHTGAEDAVDRNSGVLNADGRVVVDEDEMRAEPGPFVARRYHITRLIGRGAMGDVYLAHDVELDRHVALKFLRTSAAIGTGAVPRFIAEARATARLDHPHVATVHDVGEDEAGRLFIAMGWYAGDTLRERLSRGPLAEPDALRIAMQLAGALAAAHAAGIVHRDVKPSNVLFDANGSAKLTDFGVAKLSEADATMPGAIVGTMGYMSPEQAAGGAVDGRSDLWALGVTLFEMHVGRRPSANAELELLPDGPVRALVSRLLARDAADRPSSAADVQRELSQLVQVEAASSSASPGTSQLQALPSVVTSFVGREALLLLARTLLPRTRLMTLTGPGGTGKTRLALQLAASVRAGFPDDMGFVPLADIADASLVSASVAQVLGVREAGGSALADRVVQALRTRRMLLVLDNFEHVLAARTFVARLLTSCPHVTVLVTSREPLALQGEQEFPVPPLTTPMPFDANAAESESVQLFVERARSVRPNFQLDAQSLDAVAEICRRLDGLPLALELAAARTRLLSPRAMLDRLEHRLDLLRVDVHDRPARHRTLREVIDWSFVLLTDAERVLFTWLSVFSGGVSIEAAEAIARSIRDISGLHDASAPDVFDLLTSLCNKSLLRHEELASGEPRFFFLETVREFALERLRAAATEQDARLALRRWCLALAEEAAVELRGPSQGEWLARLQREYANLRVALDDALAQGPSGIADVARLAIALHRLWLTRGPLAEGANYLTRIIGAIDAALARGDDVPGTDTLGRLLNAAALVASSRSLFPAMRDFAARSLAVQRASGDDAAVAVTLNNLGWAIWIIGDLDGGEALSIEALGMHRARGDDLGVALSHQNLAWIAVERGQYAIGEQHFLDAIALHRRRDDTRSAALCLTWLGLLVARRGDLARALALHQEALAMPQLVTYGGFQRLHRIRIATTRHAMLEPGDHYVAVENEYLPAVREWGGLWPLAAGLGELGVMLRDAGELSRAAACVEEEIDIRHRMGARVGMAQAQLVLATIRQRQGDLAGAAALLVTAIEDARDLGSVPVVIECLEAIAALTLEHGDASTVAELLGAATHVRGELGAPRTPRAERAHQEMLSTLASALGTAAFIEASLHGATLSLHHATAMAHSLVR